MSFKYCATFLVAIGLSACAHSVAVYKKNDDLRHETLAKCAAKGLKAKNDANCKNAAKAQAEVAGDTIKSIFN